VEKLVTVATFDFCAAADETKLLLEQDGIRAFLADDNLVGWDWFFSNAVGGVKVQVAASDVDRAKGILEKHGSAKTEPQDNLPAEEVRFACQECGKSVTFPGERRGHVETCPHCGEYVDVPEDSETSPPAEPVAAASQTMPGPVEPEQPRTFVSGSRTTAQLWVEVLAILCLAYLPDLFSTLDFIWRPTTYSFVSTELWLIVRAIQVSAPLVLIMALTKDRWSLFGIVRPNWIGDVLGGFAIWAVAVVTYLFVMSLLPPSMLEHGHRLWARPEGIPAYSLLLVACAANGFAEELVMRAYLLARLERLLRSTWVAVLVTTALFASYHLYQGVTGAIGTAAIGLVYAVSFCWFRRLWPLCIAHAVTDLMNYL
jgi:membrane protease YdiL (CAAX protease family)